MQEVLDFLNEEEEKILAPDEGLEEWKKQKSEARARMVAIQRLPYEVKKKRSELRAKLALEMDKWYHNNVDLFEALYLQQPYSRDKDGKTIPYEPIESIIPAIYGQIEIGDNGDLETTGAKRTGCSMCGFGIHMEERPHRFDKLRERNPKEWEFYMYKCCMDPDTGEKYGWGRVLDYIGVGWEDIPSVQITLKEW